MLRLTQGDLHKYTDKDGNIRFDGDVIFDGNLDCRGNLYCQGSLDCQGYLYCQGSMECRGSMYCRGNLDCLGYLDCRGKHLVIIGTLFWSHTSIPKIPEKHYIRSIMPAEWQEDHYIERLGFVLSGCYEEIRKTLGEKVFSLLEEEKWLPIERMMLERIRDYDLPQPEWVAEVEK